MTSATIHRLGWKMAARHDGEQEGREGHHQVGEAHQHAPDDAAEEPRRHADQRADQTAMPLATMPMISEVRAP
jgi:ABC-type Zn2+ transport system substrate-binding protein/surface adhesin